jgi:X-Pro dipeptidyl-peptidase C-terminal non-catalytic domain
MVVQKGYEGFNNPKAEALYECREESAWPIPRTQYIKYHLVSGGSLSTSAPSQSQEMTISCQALGSLEKPELVQFSTAPMDQNTEITGKVIARLSVSIAPEDPSSVGEKDIDLFLTLRYIATSGDEVHYTGTAGDPVPLAKGWLRISMHKVDKKNPKNQSYIPHRNYFSPDVQEVKAGQVYTMDVEIWPVNVIAEKVEELCLKHLPGIPEGVESSNTRTNEVDRPRSKFAGMNNIHFGPGLENYVTLPIVPEKE